MSKQIFSLDTLELKKETIYFFDANIWMKQFSPSFDIRSRDRKYLKFFQEFEEHPDKPKVAVTTLLLSEVVNRLIRDVHYRVFLRKRGITNPDYSTFKKIFRPTLDYKIAYQAILDDIKSFHHIMIQTNDEFGGDVKLKHIMKPHGDLDFNDTYFYFLAKKKDLVVITDDADFNVEGVSIYTLNQKLL